MDFIISIPLKSGMLMSIIGYSTERELTDENDREENGLPKKKTWDSDKRSYLSSDTDWIRVTTKISRTCITPK
ncbi:MAG: hypothetical protein QMB24_17265, partial [Spirosomataceae bacterium]